MMQNLIGIHGNPLELYGMALPYNEAAAGKPAIFPGALSWSEDVPLVWEHDAGCVIASGWRVELIDTDRALFFSAILPDTAASRHAANIATSGTLRVSVETNDFAARVENGVIVKTQLSHIGLTTTPAHESTICWRNDFAPDSLTAEQRAARNSFNVAAMAYRSNLYAPAPPQSAEVIAFTKALVRDLNASAKARKVARQREFAAAHQIINEASEGIEGRRMLQAAFAGQGSAPSRGGARPGYLPRPGRRPKCPVSRVKRTCRGGWRNVRK